MHFVGTVLDYLWMMRRAVEGCVCVCGGGMEPAGSSPLPDEMMAPLMIDEKPFFVASVGC